MRNLMLGAALALVFNFAQAAEFCVTNAAELQAHLNTAEINGQADFVRIARGSYTGNFVYDSASPIGGDSFDLTIVGGFTNFFNNPCGVILSQAPSLTILDGDLAGRVLTIIARAGTNVEIRNLAFLSGEVTGSNRGGGLNISGSSGDLANVTVENNLFLGNRARYDSAVNVVFADFMAFRNNVMVANTAEVSNVASIVTGGRGGHFINNTILNNMSEGSQPGGIYFGLSGTAQALAINNILWGNDVHDVDIFDDSGRPTYLFNNSIGSVDGTPEESIGNLAVAPVFESGFLNYTLVVTSPLVDAGRKPPVFLPFPPPFTAIWTLPALDLTGRERIMGATVDIGAVESFPDELFSDGFEGTA